MFSEFTLKIKRKENRFYYLLYLLGHSLRTVSFPCIKPIHLPLYYLNNGLKLFGKRLVHSLWSVPLFKARCELAGKNLSLPNGIPLIIGNHLKIFLGDNVSIYRSTIGASKVYDKPVLRVGNNTSIGYGTTISVAKEVVIGDNCEISFNCLIMDSDDHPINPKKRLLQLPVEKEEVKPVRIGNNVWMGAYSAVLKGVSIGDNSVIAAHAVVTEDVPKNCVYAGVPAKLVVKGIDKLDIE